MVNLSYRQYHSRPCKKRKDGAPEIPFRERKSRPSKGLPPARGRSPISTACREKLLGKFSKKMGFRTKAPLQGDTRNGTIRMVVEFRFGPMVRSFGQPLRRVDTVRELGRTAIGPIVIILVNG